MAQQEAEATRKQLFELLMQAPAMIALLQGPQHVYELANRFYMEQVGQRDILGKPIRVARPELEGKGIFYQDFFQEGRPGSGSTRKKTCCLVPWKCSSLSEQVSNPCKKI